jgi:hypothetical protein
MTRATFSVGQRFGGCQRNAGRRRADPLPNRSLPPAAGSVALDSEGATAPRRQNDKSLDNPSKPPSER